LSLEVAKRVTLTACVIILIVSVVIIVIVRRHKDRSNTVWTFLKTRSAIAGSLADTLMTRTLLLASEL
jgi:hypothetical protein